MNYYVLRSAGSDPEGPYTRDELVSMWKDRRIQNACMVAAEGEKWIDAPVFFGGMSASARRQYNGWMWMGSIVAGLYLVVGIASALFERPLPSAFPWIITALLCFVVGKLDDIASKN